MSKKMICILIVSIIIVTLLPIAVDWLIIGNSIPSNITNSEWTGFLGGYIGAILGCIISLIGISWTIKFTREQNRADRELEIRPYFDIRYVPLFNKLNKEALWLGYVMIEEHYDDLNKYKETERGLLYIKNVGNGPATNIDVTVSVENIKAEHSERFNNKNTKVNSNSVRQGEEATISFLIMNNKSAPAKEEMIWNETGFADYDYTKYSIPESYNVNVEIQYNDLLGNTFCQHLKFNAVYSMSYGREKDSEYVCDIDLVQIGVPQKK